VCVVGIFLAVPAAAQQEDTPRFELGGLVFGDLYHVISHHRPDAEGATGLVLRRGYLTLNAELGGDWFGRARLEANQSGEYETYSFEVDFKDLYAGRRFGEHRLLLGLSPTPTFDLIESYWGLRYLMRTPMDLQGVASRDFGVAAAGPLNAAGTLGYRAMIGAGVNFGTESGDGRKFMGALSWQPHEDWVVDLYADYEKLSGPTDRTTLQAFVGYRGDGLRGGIQYSHQDRQEEPRLELASAFVVGRIAPEFNLIGRVDRLIAPSPRGDNIAYIPFASEAPATLYNFAVEYAGLESLRITPNVILIHYDRADDGSQPRTDRQLRITLFLDLE
jgi:hypothetical protein